MDERRVDCANSIFQQPWWLDAVAPGRWREIALLEEGRTVARLPFLMDKWMGLAVSRMPPLTQTLGPAVDAGDGGPTRRFGGELDLLEQLLASLPAVDYFAQNLHFSVAAALPFHWYGFRLETRYTHVLRDLEAAADIAYFRSSARREIRKAQRSLAVRTDLGLDRFVAVNRMSFERQGIRLPYQPEVLARVDAACRQRSAATTYFAEDASGRVHAAIYIVRDRCASYYLLGGADPELRTSGAHSLLMWHAIRDSVGVSGCFDFEGSMNRAIGRFFRSFNPEVRAFVFVERSSPRFAPFRLALRTWRRLRSGNPC